MSDTAARLNAALERGVPTVVAGPPSILCAHSV